MSRPYSSAGRPSTSAATSNPPYLDPRYQYPDTPTTASTSTSDVQWAYGPGSNSRPYTGAGEDLYEEDEYVESEDEDVFAYLPPTTAEQGEWGGVVSARAKLISVIFYQRQRNSSSRCSRCSNSSNNLSSLRQPLSRVSSPSHIPLPVPLSHRPPPLPSRSPPYTPLSASLQQHPTRLLTAAHLKNPSACVHSKSAFLARHTPQRSTFRSVMPARPTTTRKSGALWAARGARRAEEW